ncbi:hypothetical protein Tco_1372439 [Tanacetum coccineum]
MSRVNRPGEDNEAGDMMGVKRDGNNLGDKPLFASVLHKEYRNKKVNFRTLVTNNTDLADVPIPMSSILEVHTRADGALKNIMVISVPNLIGNGCPKCGMADLRKQGGTSNHGFQTIQRKDFHGPFGHKKGDTNGKHMDDLVDDTQKKIEAPLKKTPRKTSIWSGREADSPK